MASNRKKMRKSSDALHFDLSDYNEDRALVEDLNSNQDSSGNDEIPVIKGNNYSEFEEDLKRNDDEECEKTEDLETEIHQHDDEECEKTEDLETEIHQHDDEECEKTEDLETHQQKTSFSVLETPRDKKILLLVMAICNFCAAANFSILGPFFPEEAAKKGTNQTVTGMIFGIFELVSFLVSPVFGNYMSRIGTKFMFVAGVTVSGACTILFGVLNKCPAGYQFILMSFLCRTLEALASAAFVTSSYTILANAFPKYIATVVGYLELFTGVGMMVGPAIGGALYSISGYGLPFYVLGSVLIVSGAISYFIMPNASGVHKPLSKSVLHLLRSPLALFTAACIIAGSYAISYLEATLANHLHKLQIGTVSVSLMFLIPPGLYAISSPVWGWISDTKGHVFSLVIAGGILSSVFFLTIGPSPILPFLPLSLWLVVISLIGIGIFLGCLMIPTFTALLLGAERLGMQDNLDTFGIVSGFYNSCYSLGAFVGPISGSALADAAGFGWGASLCAGLLILNSTGLLIFIAYIRKHLQRFTSFFDKYKKFAFRKIQTDAEIEMLSKIVEKEETDSS